MATFFEQHREKIKSKIAHLQKMRDGIDKTIAQIEKELIEFEADAPPVMQSVPLSKLPDVPEWAKVKSPAP